MNIISFVLQEQLSLVSRGCNDAKNKARRMMESARAATGEPDAEGELIPKAYSDVRDCTV